ncbi:uncharacterized protein SCHCODRAFT_02617613, partial [Schizophyllum commune H4-8]|uniref:uncharacterized protein n=1 Tax=Schizophyllum commune (strain H4-8 / FGSC 9210) TaxID=578458 RepID=UPI00215EBD81
MHPSQHSFSSRVCYLLALGHPSCPAFWLLAYYFAKFVLGPQSARASSKSFTEVILPPDVYLYCALTVQANTSDANSFLFSRRLLSPQPD